MTDYINDAHLMECPHCGRRTVYCSKANGAPRVNPDPDKYVIAVNRSGVCYTCYRATSASYQARQANKSRKAEKAATTPKTPAGGTVKRDRRSSGVTNASLGIHNRNFRDPGMSEEQIEYLRRAVTGMIKDRRARGIPPWGMDTADFQYGNGGLYASEVK